MLSTYSESKGTPCGQFKDSKDPSAETSLSDITRTTSGHRRALVPFLSKLTIEFATSDRWCPASRHHVVAYRSHWGRHMARVISDITRDRPAPFGYSFDRIVIELARARLTVDGREVQAPTLPLRLLQALCERPGVFARLPAGHRQDADRICGGEIGNGLSVACPA